MRGGGCFAGDSLVEILAHDMTWKTIAIALVRAGDRIRTGEDSHAPVRCVVETLCVNGKAELVTVHSALRVTPWHPMREGRGAWTFPAYHATPEVVPCFSVFNLVLEADHTLHFSIAGASAVTLGHGFVGDVVAHDYWGTTAVLADLQERDTPGWTAGHITLATPLTSQKAAFPRRLSMRAFLWAAALAAAFSQGMVVLSTVPPSTAPMPLSHSSVVSANV